MGTEIAVHYDVAEGAVLVRCSTWPGWLDLNKLDEEVWQGLNPCLRADFQQIMQSFDLFRHCLGG